MKRLLALLLCLITLCPLAAAERLDDRILLTYYDDTLFIGDSIMQGFRRYRSAMRQDDPSFLEGATVVCTSSISLYVGSRRYLLGDFHFNYRGSDRTMYDIARITKPKRIFILLGLNDPVGIKIDRAMEWIEYIVVTMKEFAPDAEVCFFSHTPITENYCRTRKRPGYQEKLDEYNRRLRETCERTGATYIEIAEPLKGPDGYLSAAYCSDNLCHLNDEGQAVWVRCLIDHAQAEYDAGRWSPWSEETSAEASEEAAEASAGADPEPETAEAGPEPTPQPGVLIIITEGD